MTELLYQTDSCLRTFTATVVAVNDDARAIALDRTVLYPGGGGQPDDRGELCVQDQTLAVTRVKRQGDQVWHWLELARNADRSGNCYPGSRDAQSGYWHRVDR